MHSEARQILVSNLVVLSCSTHIIVIYASLICNMSIDELSWITILKHVLQHLNIIPHKNIVSALRGLLVFSVF